MCDRNGREATLLMTVSPGRLPVRCSDKKLSVNIQIQADIRFLRGRARVVSRAWRTASDVAEDFVIARLL
jgi:hypothetical protein